MIRRYESAEEIPDEAIVSAYEHVDFIKFSVVENNFLSNRKISIGDLGFWLPAVRVLDVLGFSPQVLRPAFNPQRRFQLSRSLQGIPSVATPYEVELPETVTEYNQLGSLRLEGNDFGQLARIVGKPVELWLQFDEDGSMLRYLRTHLENGLVVVDPFYFS